MGNQGRLGTLLVLGSILVLLVLGWSACVRAQEVAGRRAAVVQMLEMGRQELRMEAEALLDVRDPRWLPPGVKDRQTLALHLVRQVLRSGNVRHLRNAYNVGKPAFQLGRAGSEPGAIYVDPEQVDPVAGGAIRLTGIWLDGRRRPQRWEVDIPMDFDLAWTPPKVDPAREAYERSRSQVEALDRAEQLDRRGWRSSSRAWEREGGTRPPDGLRIEMTPKR